LCSRDFRRDYYDDVSAEEQEECEAREFANIILDVYDETESGADSLLVAAVAAEEGGEGKAPDGRNSKHSAQLTWNGVRIYKAIAVNAQKQCGTSKRISSTRLLRVQEAAKQLEKNRDPLTSAADTATVLQLGSDFAFAFDESGGGSIIYFGRVLQMKRKNGSQMNTPITLDSAKMEDVRVVCSWFKETKNGEFLHDSDSDHTAYSTWSVLAKVDFMFKKEHGYYLPAYPEAIERLQLALDLTEAQTEARGEVVDGQPAGRQSNSGDTTADSIDKREVLRAPGKRRATSAVLGK